MTTKGIVVGMNEKQLHSQLPIGENEKILATIRHHWFTYVSIYFGAGFICVMILAFIILIAAGQSQLGISDSAVTAVAALGIGFMAVVVVFSFIPVWIKKQEMLVLTEEALLQIKKPSLFASKVSQLNLQHIADVTVNQDTLGSAFGFANLTIETPGEQDNYDFKVVADARAMAKAIIEAHENYAAALESGQIQTTLGRRAPVPGNAWREAAPMPQNSPQPQTGGQQPTPAQPAPQYPQASPGGAQIPEPPRTEE